MCEFCMDVANGGSEGEFNQFSVLYGTTPVVVLFIVLILWSIRIYLESSLNHSKNKVKIYE